MRIATSAPLSISNVTGPERLLPTGTNDSSSALGARIVQLAGEGKPVKQIAAILGVTPKTVANWQKRFTIEGQNELFKDKPGPGRPRFISSDQVDQIRARFGQKRCSTRMVARLVGVSPATVRRIWKSQGMPPL